MNDVAMLSCHAGDYNKYIERDEKQENEKEKEEENEERAEFEENSLSTSLFSDVMGTVNVCDINA